MEIIVVWFLLFDLNFFYQPEARLRYLGQTVLTSEVHKKQYLDSAREAFDLINEVRIKGCNCGDKYWEPVQKLIWNDTIALAAYRHAQDLQEQDYFSHIGLDGSDPTVRLDRVEYKYHNVGENIAKGQNTAEWVVKDWLESPGHCSNIMKGYFIYSGIGRYENTWSQTFASPKRE